LFVSYRKKVVDKAISYLFGLTRNGIRKNMSQISEFIVDADSESIQNFISDSKWSAVEVMDSVAQDVDEKIGDENNACLLLDESGFAKKGNKSVGVARQWLGNLGKVDNGQVGVFAALCKDTDVALINGRLYLPEEWINDKERCLDAHVPESEIRMLTKEDIALDMVRHARETGMRFGWVGADAGYGKGLAFLQGLEDMNETFMIDVHSSFHIFARNPKPFLPDHDESQRGRHPSRYKSAQQSVRVDEWVKKQPQSAWQRIKIRKSTKGVLRYDVLNARVWVWEKDAEKVFQWHLVVRRNPGTKSDIKYSLCNADENTTVQRLAYMQAQRFWIERAFEDAKGDCGMADYEVRGWDGWHHHMALVMLAQSFLLDERILNRDTHPLLSTADVVALLTSVIPQKNKTVEQVAEAMKRRHERRMVAMKSAARCQVT
jgi:SRSO17 transposase